MKDRFNGWLCLRHRGIANLSRWFPWPARDRRAGDLKAGLVRMQSPLCGSFSLFLW
jgi:hypothetical protein